tara:strand:- start:650 stop:2578 length:1929 start_codon:yes stop_codon:yes gene_type:complete
MGEKSEVKTLIYELFSGVGFCNQLFSLETAIYLANISNRKLILLIKNPLCHCGSASWDYGYLLNYFTNDFLEFLPNGFDVYYKQPPKNILDIINNKEKTKTFVYSDKFSNLVFVDKNLDTAEHIQNIKNYCHYRKKEYLQFEENDKFEYFYINQGNASRCLYNFYTNSNNYKLMYQICCSLKFKDFYFKCSENLYSTLNNKQNSYNISIHCRFGDNHKDIKFIERYNSDILKNVSNFLNGHHTNLIKPNLIILYDNKNNTKFFKEIEKYKPLYIESITNNFIKNYLDNNKMLCHDIFNIKKYEVATAIIEIILSSKSDEFIGTATSTLSHYIQFLRYKNHKSYYNYLNIEKPNIEYCRLQPLKESRIPWIKYQYFGGHPISWHHFWEVDSNRPTTMFTIFGKTDGFGSQLQACFSLIAYCYYKNYTYIHTPMYKMHHNDENIKNFPDHMNKFINFESKFKSVNQLSNYEISILNNVKEGPFVHGSLHPEYFYNTHVLNLFREIYYSNSKPTITTFDNTKKNIAVHIRRGDVNPEKYPSRFISNKVYIDLIKKIDLSNSLIHIFSEGNIDDFNDIIESFSENKFIFHLNENIQLSFHSMVKADILVISKSSFSYCAALLNENIIIANLTTSWWHKPLKNWKKI